MALKVVSTDSRDGKVVVALDNDGIASELVFDTMECQTIISALHASLEEAAKHPLSASRAALHVDHLQFQQTSETVFFRVFLTDRLFHEYQIPADTTIADDLMMVADRNAARQEAKITHSEPGGLKN